MGRWTAFGHLRRTEIYKEELPVQEDLQHVARRYGARIADLVERAIYRLGEPEALDYLIPLPEPAYPPWRHIRRYVHNYCFDYVLRYFNNEERRKYGEEADALWLAHISSCDETDDVCRRLAAEGEAAP